MSTLELNGRVFDASTTGTLTLTSEGSNATTNVTQGLAKAWVNLDGTSSGAAARDSFNVASTTDTGTGNYKQTFTNNMSNDDYAHNVTGRGSTVCFGGNQDGNYATSTMGIYLFNVSGQLVDAAYGIATLHGDLA
mgnify:CR=1 FL=1|jgi:hypothetical protein|tara:strand:+ start:376 stop:780 length:405 start_codon:yes stop_codon:yes gene_type:complete